MLKLKFLLCPLIVFIVSCSDDYTIDSASDLDVTLTDYNPNTDFSSFCKYYMAPIVPATDDSYTMTEQTEAAIYAYTEANLDALNYVKVDDENEADIIVDFFVASTDYVSINSWYYQGSYWWWGYNDGWTVYSPNLNSYYMYSSGSLVTTMTSKALDAVEDNPAPYWFSLMNGVLEKKNAQSNTARVEASINQGFSQSTYLKRSTKCTP